MMYIEEKIIQLLGPLVNNHVYWDEVELEDADADPVIVLQIVGGKHAWYMDNEIPEYQNARLQVVVLATDAIVASSTMKAVERAMASGVVICRPIGEFKGSADFTTQKREKTMQFSIWHKDS